MRQAPLFVEAGANALHVSASAQETTEWQFLPYMYPAGALVPLAEAVKKAVNVPIIAVGKLDDPILANRVLNEGKADFIAIGRGLMADPDLPNKIKEGRLKDICHCIYCNNCMAVPQTDRMKFGGNFCTVNPALFREREFAIKPTDSPKNVLVVGGGLAGMEAAQVLTERGHHVTIYEKENTLGGQWNIASQQEFKQNYASVTERMSRKLAKSGVKIILNKEANAKLVRELQPDTVVLATGAIPMTPDVPGANGKNVVQANDVITRKVKPGNKVAVIGGRLLGMEVAVFLARQGKQVSLVTRSQIGGAQRVERNTYRALLHMLIDYGVHLYPNSPLLEIGKKGVYINYDNDLLFLGADTVILAVGTKAQNSLMKEIKGIIPEVYAIGDCVEPRDALRAIREGAELGRQI